MKPIITLTLSPAFDLHCFCSDFCAERENLATVQSYDAGGKGINISRALRASGIDSLALTLLGKDNAAEFAQRLDAEGICVRGGLHCAPLSHAALGTQSTGTVRVSFSFFNTREEIDHFALRLRSLLP